MSERRYDEDEVAEIIRRAAEAQQSARLPLASGEGMTLVDLQEIGQDVGIHPALISEAARSLDARGRGGFRTLFGFPIGVRRTVELGRHLSDAEWERLVVDLRETFDARGKVGSHGSLRQWTNGNLHALVEPTPEGDRVRLQTSKGDARAYMMTGMALMAGSAVATIAMAIGGGINDAGSLGGVGFMGLSGLGLFGAGALRLPRWARLRRRQMEGVAARLTLPADERPALRVPADEAER